ncbi:hypothetical protein CYMTET_22411, partial [Cymbomonas tetramitiformis]
MSLDERRKLEITHILHSIIVVCVLLPGVAGQQILLEVEEKSVLPEVEDNPPPRKTNRKSEHSHLLGHELAVNSGDSRILSEEDVPLLTEAAHILVQAVTEERSNAKSASLRVVKASSRLVRLYELQVQVGWENSEYGSRLLHSIQGSVVDVGDSVLHFLEGTVSNTSGVDANETFSFSEAGSVNKQDAGRPAFQGFSRDKERALLQQASPPSPGSNSTVPAKGITNDLTSRQQGPPPSDGPPAQGAADALPPMQQGPPPSDGPPAQGAADALPPMQQGPPPLDGPPAQGGSEGDLLTRYTAAPSAAAQSWLAPPELDQQHHPPPPEPYQLPSSCRTE